MKSVQLVARRCLETREMPMPPDPGPGEVLVKIRTVGICGSDMHWYLDGHIGASQVTYPQVLGHEPAGEIVAVGRGVDVKLGSKVAVEPAITCGYCEQCRSGRHNNCLHGLFMGAGGKPGLFLEYATMPLANAVPIPEGMSFTQATIIEPLAVILHVLELIGMRLGDTVAILGAGPIGLLMATMARMAGAGRVFIADRVEHRLAMARTLGVDLAVNLATGSFEDAVRDLTRSRGVDVAIDAAGSIEAINRAVAVARMGGKVVMLGIPGADSKESFDVNAAMGKELNLQTIRRSNHNAHAAMELLTSGRIPECLVTHHYPLEQTPLAFQTLAEYADGVGKVLIDVA
jgi:L-iditol 2-dehydrogenase